jgi:hypothetical protein
MSGKRRCPKQGRDRRTNQPQRHRGGRNQLSSRACGGIDRLRTSPQVADKWANDLKFKRLGGDAAQE